MLKVSYDDFCRLKKDNDFRATLILKDLRENQPETFSYYELAYRRASEESQKPEEGLSLAYEDITTYEQFVETIQKSNEEREYHGNNQFFSKRLQRFIARDRQQYLEFAKRLREEARQR